MHTGENHRSSQHPVDRKCAEAHIKVRRWRAGVPGTAALSPIRGTTPVTSHIVRTQRAIQSPQQHAPSAARGRPAPPPLEQRRKRRPCNAARPSRWTRSAPAGSPHRMWSAQCPTVGAWTFGARRTARHRRGADPQLARPARRRLADGAGGPQEAGLRPRRWLRAEEPPQHHYCKRHP